jgi:cellobiose phosphorylase
MEVRQGDTLYQIHVENPAGISRKVRQVILDGKELPDNRIPLLKDGEEHRVHVVMEESATNR